MATSHALSTSGPTRIGVLMGDKSNPFWTSLQKHLTDLAPHTGFEPSFFWAEREGDGAAQLHRFREMLNEPFPAIIINPLDTLSLMPGIFEAVGRGMKIIDVGAKMDQLLMADARPAYLPVRTVDFLEQGRMAGHYIRNRIVPGDPVVIIGGRPGAAQSIGRCNGAAEVLIDAGIGITVSRAADFERVIARKVAKEIFDRYVGIKAFFCANDFMALGVADTVAEKKLPQGPIIVGVDFIPEAADAIRNGLITASVGFSRADVARLVLQGVHAALNGDSWPEGYGVKSYLADRDSVDDFPV